MKEREKKKSLVRDFFGSSRTLTFVSRCVFLFVIHNKWGAASWTRISEEKKKHPPSTNYYHFGWFTFGSSGFSPCGEFRNKRHCRKLLTTAKIRVIQPQRTCHTPGLVSFYAKKWNALTGRVWSSFKDEIVSERIDKDCFAAIWRFFASCHFQDIWSTLLEGRQIEEAFGMLDYSKPSSKWLSLDP